MAGPEKGERSIRSKAWSGRGVCVFAPAGPLLRGAAYLQLTALAPPATDTAQVQQLLATLSAPRLVPGTASNISALAVTTECDPLQQQQKSRDCHCLPGYQWSDTFCQQLSACGGGLIQSLASLVLLAPCQCLRWTLPGVGFCRPPASPVSESTTLAPKLASVGAEGALNLSFSLKEGATDVKWYLLRPDWTVAKDILNGTQVTLQLQQDGSEALLGVSSVSPDWAGVYICRYRYEGSLREVRQVVGVPLGPADVVLTLSQVSMNCSSPEQLTLRCCIRNRGSGIRASWNPGSSSPAHLTGKGDTLCQALALDSCPSGNTSYQCIFESDDLGSVQTEVVVSGIQDGDLFCPSEATTGSWNTTKAGQVAELLCPTGSTGKMLRSCSSRGSWGGVQSNCTSQELLSGLRQAQLLQAGLGNPVSEVPGMMEWLETKTRQTQEGSPWDLLAVISTMDIISQVALGYNLRLDGDAVASLLTAANWMLALDPETEWAEVEAVWPPAGSRFLQGIEDLTSLLQLSASEFSLSLPNVELQSARFEGPVEADYSKAFDMEPPLRTHIAREQLEDLVRQEGEVTVTSLALKKLDRILPENSDTASSRGLGSLVLSNAIMSPNGSVKQVDIDMTFGHWNLTHGKEGQQELVAQCVFWNHSLPEGVGGWSTQGCRTSGAGTATNCTCCHLTSFSILMSAKPVPVSFALTFLSKFGICASILALLASLAIYYLVWTSVVKNKVSYFRYTTLVNMAFSLLMGNLWFLVASQLAASPENKLCVAVAFFTHFSYLAVFCWMLIQALLLFHQLIFVFHQLTVRSILPAMVVVGYVCPLAIAVATVAAFSPTQGYLQEAVCWLSSGSRAIYAFSVPVLLIVAINLLILFVVLLKLMRPSVSEGPPGEERKALLSLFKALLILTPVFGLTWGLGVITMTTEASQLTHYAFTILNAFQGVFILLFGCLMDKKAVDAVWKNRKQGWSSQTEDEEGNL
ncbi:adhesion G-protein coupled receptor F3 isoform X2 [Hemicordylus capensis]|uniref:adhesion G-protein coupled receptor F3 isoform X2 n=1 Tax=Hemicordylus capensis TaxID=884348 RepID=UPI0023036ADF|nr:adhesion G-protein coupled receptor F3 isoform X2 [Hemicordylus capensis]